MVLSEVFWISFVATASGFLLKCASLAYKSKCKECSFCGIRIIRDTEAETEVDELIINRQPIIQQQSSPTINRDGSVNNML
tara:strand:+ start:130 stop:372 length:243 start_codon:yes stop_codon:yes gene_type:complete